MTFLGKLLVFLNVILATALLSWSVSLYTNRVEWSAVTTDGKKIAEWPPQYTREAATNNAHYADAKDAIAVSERQLTDRTRLLAAKLQQARGGQFFELDRPGVKPGQFATDRFDLNSDRKTLIAKKDNQLVPLLGFEILQAELQKTVDATTGTDDQRNIPPADLAADPTLGLTGKKGFAALSKKLVALDARVAGYNNSIERYRVAIVQRENEKNYLDDNRVNWDAQLITLQKRNDQLLDRLKTFGITVPTAAAPTAPALAGGSR